LFALFDKKSIKPKAIDSNSNCLETNYTENPAEPVKNPACHQTISSSTSQASLPSKEISSNTCISSNLHLSSFGFPLMNHTDSCQTSSNISNQLSEEQDDPKVDDDTPQDEWSHLSPVLRSLSTILKRS
jgi:hypothetical protein